MNRFTIRHLWSLTLLPIVLSLLSTSSTTGGNGQLQGNGRMQPGKPGMTNQRLQTLLEGVSTILDGQLGFWRVQFEDRELFIITDQTHNRMRIMTPIIEEEKLTEEDLRAVLSANFDRALDARFALASDHLWAVFIHPLAELSDEQFLDGLKQVSRLADNYGGSYSSTDLVFGGG